MCMLWYTFACIGPTLHVYQKPVESCLGSIGKGEMVKEGLTSNSHKLRLRKWSRWCFVQMVASGPLLKRLLFFLFCIDFFFKDLRSVFNHELRLLSSEPTDCNLVPLKRTEEHRDSAPAPSDVLSDVKVGWCLLSSYLQASMANLI